MGSMVEQEDGEGGVTRNAELLLDQVGPEALGYIFNLSEEEYEQLKSKSTLPDRVTGDDRYFPMVSNYASVVSGKGSSMLCSHFWTQLMFGPVGERNLIDSIRHLCGVRELDQVIPTHVDDMMRAFAHDLHVAALLPSFEGGSYFGGGNYASGYFAHPLRASFEKAVMSDGDLGKLFPKVENDGMRTGYVRRSSGTGGTIGLTEVASCCLNYGNILCRVRGREVSPDVVAEGAIEGLNILRAGARGEEFETTVVVGVAGSLAESLNRVDFGDALLIRVPHQDRERLVPVSRSVEAGNSPYECEDALVLSFPVRDSLEFAVDRESIGGPWECENFASETRQRIENIILGSVLSDRSRKPAIKEKWSVCIGPFSGGGVSHSIGDGIFHGPHPCIDSRFVRTWESKVTALDKCDQTQILIPRSRLLSAVEELRSPADSLVDALIAWESFFGTGAEITFQVTASMAWVFHPRLDQYDERISERRSLGKIYGMRSTIVHGGVLKSQEKLLQGAHEAIDAAARLIEIIACERSDLLSLNVKKRTESILLGTFIEE